MTITYTAEVATSSFSCFLKLLARWRGSIYKLLWRDFAVFAVIYFLLSFLYRFAFNDSQRRIFELISRYCESNNALIPVAFILGFYVTLIMTRYWNCLSHIPWPDHMAMYVTANVQGLDDRGRMMRRTMLRYFCLSYTMTMAAISPTVKKRFPTFEHMVQAGLLTSNEAKSLEQIDTPHNKFFIPLAWTTRLVNMARKERRIEDEFALKTLIDEINQFRMHLATLFVYDWITVPLVYTQVVTVAVYMFFLACLMGRQFLTDDPDVPDLFFPLFTFLEYFFYMGWLKVAECLVNPFGEDEEDFDVNFLIDRNLQVAYIIVDEVYKEPPDLVRDQYWNETHFEMPYTAAAEQFRTQPHFGSTADIRSVRELDFGGAGREEMDTIEEADDVDEQDSDFGGVGSARPSHSFFQSPLTSTGNVLRRLLSRQESRSQSRPSIAIAMTHRKGSRSPSVAQSPAITLVETPRNEELQFPMETEEEEEEEEHREADADENLLIEKGAERSRAKGAAHPIPIRNTRPPSPTLTSRSHTRTLGQAERRLDPSSHPYSMKSSSQENELRNKAEKMAPDATPRNSGIIDVPPTPGVDPFQTTRTGATAVPASALKATELGPLVPGASASPSTFGAAATRPLAPSPAAVIPPAAFDSYKEMIDFTDEVLDLEAAEPASPTSPDPSDPVWVLASSRFSLAALPDADKSRKTDDDV